jgi:hypothetical protein
MYSFPLFYLPISSISSKASTYLPLDKTNLGDSLRTTTAKIKHINAIEAFNNISPRQLPFEKSYKKNMQSKTSIILPN